MASASSGAVPCGVLRAERDENESEVVRVAAMRALAIMDGDERTRAAEAELPDPVNRRADEAAISWWTRTAGKALPGVAADG